MTESSEEEKNPYPVTVTVLNELSSDHFPICLKVDLIISFSPPPTVALDWVKFTNHLANQDITFLEIISTTDIDNAVNLLNSKITDAQNHAISRRLSNNCSFTLPRFIYDLIKQLN